MPEDTEDVAKGSRARKDRRESNVEGVLVDVREDLGEQSYPTTSEQLASTYADGPIDLPNETESLDSAFDRMNDTFENAEEAYRALLSEFEGGTYHDARAEAGSGDAVWGEERIDDSQPPADRNTEGGPEESKERARRMQAAESESDGDE